MRRILNQNNTSRFNRIKVRDEILYRSISKNSNYKIALQLYYISKENKKEARLPKNDFRRPVIKPGKEISVLRRLINQFNNAQQYRHFSFLQNMLSSYNSK
jgi:hypothetical protein